MRGFWKHARGLTPWLAAAMTVSVPLSSRAALTVAPSFDAAALAAPGAVADIGTAIHAIEALFGNNLTIGVYFSVVSMTAQGSVSTSFNDLSYNAYRSVLAADAAANPANTVLSGALTYLPGGSHAPASANDAARGTPIAIATAQAQAIAATLTPRQAQIAGLAPADVAPCFDAQGVAVQACGGTSTGAGANTAVITLADYLGYQGIHQAQTVAVIEHELIEVLGGGGAGSTLNDVAFCQATTGGSTCAADPQAALLGPTDLYRYAAAGADCASVTPAGSFTTNSTAASCYSLNGGQTALVQFNQGPVGDFGDFYPAGSAIQAYTGSTTLPLSATSPEFTMLASIGYDPVTVSAPEPAGLLSLGTALPMMFAARRRMPRRVGAAA